MTLANVGRLATIKSFAFIAEIETEITSDTLIEIKSFARAMSLSGHLRCGDVDGMSAIAPIATDFLR